MMCGSAGIIGTAATIVTTGGIATGTTGRITTGAITRITIGPIATIATDRALACISDFRADPHSGLAAPERMMKL